MKKKKIAVCVLMYNYIHTYIVFCFFQLNNNILYSEYYVYIKTLLP